MVAALYAMNHAAHVQRLVQIGPMPPNAGKQYPAHLTNADQTLADIAEKLTDLQRERTSADPQDLCQRFWALLRVLYVADPADANKIRWDRCNLPNEWNFMKYWSSSILPSIYRLELKAEDFARLAMPVLILHGVKDRSTPYGGGREWAMALPDARLVTIENAAHAPWIENPGCVFEAIETFLDGAWPGTAEKVISIDPEGDSTD
jgi:pimeloyl-ACP methyl ester carboxylesterase